MVYSYFLVMLFALAGELYDSFAVEHKSRASSCTFIERGFYGTLGFNNNSLVKINEGCKISFSGNTTKKQEEILRNLANCKTLTS